MKLKPICVKREKWELCVIVRVLYETNLLIHSNKIFMKLHFDQPIFISHVFPINYQFPLYHLNNYRYKK